MVSHLPECYVLRNVSTHHLTNAQEGKVSLYAQAGNISNFPMSARTSVYDRAHAGYVSVQLTLATDVFGNARDG